MDGVDFDDYRLTDGVAPFIAAHQLVADDPAVQLIELHQPAGDFSDPPLNDLVITVGLSMHRTSYRNGSFRFSGTAVPGQWSLLARGEANAIVIDDSNHFRALAVDGLLADTLLDRMFDGRPPDIAKLHAVQASNGVPQLIERLWRLSSGSHASAITTLYRDSVIVTLLGELAALNGDAARLTRGGLAPWQERRVNDYLQANFSRDITLLELASLCSLSPDHFSRAFKQSFGVAPQKYQMLLRLNAAQTLLLQPDLSIDTVAVCVGYKGQAGLNKLFIRELGVTPLNYRRRMV